MKAVEVDNLRKEFVRKDGRKRVRVEALHGLTFAVARGECIAVLGQNRAAYARFLTADIFLKNDGRRSRARST
jgi:ABC-type antimicrobial peptide transport system ATPase subunit